MNIHRIIRRSTTYRRALRPERAIRSRTTKSPRGAHFIFISAKAMATMEFLQQEWINNGNFMSLGDERDPNVGLQEDGATFTIPQEPVRRRIHGIETFNVLRGGEYFFMPSLSALQMAAGTSTSERSADRCHPISCATRPEIETIDPHIDELLAQIIEFWEKKVRESPTTEGTGRAVRGAHAKTFGVVKAEVEILRSVPRGLRAGHLRQARPPRRADPVLQRLQPPGHGRAPRSGSGLRDQDLRCRRIQAGRRRAGLDHVRPRAEEQPDLRRQHGEALSGLQEIGNDAPSTSRAARRASTSS